MKENGGVANSKSTHERKLAAEHRQAVEALRISETQLSNALKIAHLGHWEYDVANDLFTFSDHFYAMFHTTAEQVGGYTMSSSDYAQRFVHPDDISVVSSEIRKALETTDPHYFCQLEHRIIYPDGKPGYIAVRIFIVKDDRGRTVKTYGVNQDITERKMAEGHQRELEAERLKTQKLEAIGTLAGGIAHDFNNLLQGVSGYISLAKMSLSDREKTFAMLERAGEALNAAVNLTSQLLTFSKGGKPVKKTMALGPLIENAVTFALSGSRSDYRFAIAEDLWSVEADEGQIVQVIQNIVLNASEVTPEGGTVEISAENVDISAGDNPSFPEGGQFVRISIKDPGVGIPEQHKSRIFEPYFTTKQRGSGLGLATSYSIIRNHGGIIDVSSETNKGSTFFVYLPAKEGKAYEEYQGSAPPAGRKGRVLVMDDEEVVRAVAKEMIGTLGYEAECAKDGEDAVEKFREATKAGKPFDIVILDLTVRGGMGGEQTVRKLREIDPDVKAVVSSGYAENAVLSDYRSYGFTAVLNKPYTIAALTDILSALLG